VRQAWHTALVKPTPVSVARVAEGEVTIAVLSATHGDTRLGELARGSTLARLHFDRAPAEPRWTFDVLFMPGVPVSVGDQFAMDENGALRRDGARVEAWVGVPPGTVVDPAGWYD
jgi:hypothetical protein